MDLGQLEMFLAVAQEESFSRAANRVHRTQSAVSQAIQRLEAEIGTPLFDRSTRSGVLTQAGRVLQEYAQQMLNLRREATGAIEELSTLRRGKLAIAANEYTVMHLIPVLAAYRTRHPHLTVEIQRSLASQIPSQVLAHEVEIGAITYHPVERGLTVVPFASDDLALLVAPGHPLAKRSVVSIRELGAEPVLAHKRRSLYRDRVLQTFERHRTPHHFAMELPTLEAIKRLVELEVGVALMPRQAAEAEIARGQIVAIPVREMRFHRSVQLVHRSGTPLSHAAQAFVACARQSSAAVRGTPPRARRG